MTHMARGLALISAILTTAIACGHPPDPMPDGGLPSDAAAPRDAEAGGGVGFDPSMTYPGEGEPCEFSLFCSELQICVDGECARHERFDEGELVLGPPTRISDELLRTSTLYTEAVVDWDPVSIELFGTIIPGPFGPILTFFEHRSQDCQVAIYGDGPPRVIYVADMSCATAAVSPDGYVMLGGMGVAPDYQKKWALAGPDGQIIAEGGYPDLFQRKLEEETGDPEIELFSITSILWHAGRFLFSVAAGRAPDGGPGDFLSIGGPRNPTHTFYAELNLDGTTEVTPIAGAVAHVGSFGWLVRDEGGVRSILTVFNDPFEPTDLRIDLLSWGNGAREELASGARGSEAGTARYVQLDTNRWVLVERFLAGGCGDALLDQNGVFGRVRVDPTAPCEMYPFHAIGHMNQLGSSAAYGAAYIGSTALPWLADHYPAGDLGPSLFGPDDSAIIDLSLEDARVRYVGTIHGVARFGRTLELFVPLAYEGDPTGALSYWEFSLSRGEE